MPWFVLLILVCLNVFLTPATRFHLDVEGRSKNKNSIPTLESSFFLLFD